MIAIPLMQNHSMSGVRLTFGEWLKDRLIALKLSQSDLARLLKVSQSTVSAWTNDVQPPRVHRLAELADVLQVSVSDVAEAANVNPHAVAHAERRHARDDRTVTPSRALQVVFIPIIGIAPADSTRWASEVGGALPMAAGEADGLGDPAIVIASGDCMTGRGIQTGDHVLLDRQAVPEPGDVVMMRVGDEFSLKEWWPEGDEFVILRPAAPGYSPIRIRRDQENVEIIGVARKRIRVTDV